jgi:DNA-binding NarL/FixJ family response regulator
VNSLRRRINSIAPASHGGPSSGSQLAWRIALVDDQEIVRRGLAELIDSTSRFEVVAEASSAEEALEAFAAHEVDLVLADLILGDGPDGIQLTKAIKAEYPLLPVLVLSGRDETLFAERALLAGASGYLMKEEAVAVLLEAIETAIAGGVWVSRAMSERLLPRASSHPIEPAPVTDEWNTALVEELRRGNRTVAGISRALATNHMTVERGLDGLMERLGLLSRAGLYLYVQEMGA